MDDPSRQTRTLKAARRTVMLAYPLSTAAFEYAEDSALYSTD